ncbi:MAG: hypothetical protein AB2598_04230 [Candidatus Thiodiazotropha sp.]
MNLKRLLIATSLVALTLSILPLSAADKMTDASVGQTTYDSHADSLVIVDQILGIDSMGKQHVLYNEEDGRVYRLHNIEQAIHDLNARGITTKGSFRSLKAVLSDTVYLMGENSTPYPAKRSETSIPKFVTLSVEHLRVTKDRVIAIYSTNCDINAI